MIKHFKGQRLLGFYFSFEISQSRAQKQLRQCNFLVHTLLYVKEAVLRSATFSWSVAFHAIRTREEHLRKSTKEANFITKGAIESVRINEVSVLSASWHESKKYLFTVSNLSRPILTYNVRLYGNKAVLLMRLTVNQIQFTNFEKTAEPRWCAITKWTCSVYFQC